jgi:hypothetical protein
MTTTAGQPLMSTLSAPSCRDSRRPAEGRRRLTIATLGLGVALVVLGSQAASGQLLQAGNSSAFGESISLQLLSLLGSPLVTVSSGPLPTVAGSAPPSYSATQTAVSVGVSAPILGNILQTGLLRVDAASQTTPAGVESDATISGLQLNVGALGALVNLAADTIGTQTILTCAGYLPATTGTLTLTNPRLTVLGIAVAVAPNLPPNTVLINLLGITVTANEQILVSAGPTNDLVVNAIHVSFNGAALAGLGLLNGDIVLAQSHVQLRCLSPE